VAISPRKNKPTLDPVLLPVSAGFTHYGSSVSSNPSMMPSTEEEVEQANGKHRPASDKLSFLNNKKFTQDNLRIFYKLLTWHYPEFLEQAENWDKSGRPDPHIWLIIEEAIDLLNSLGPTIPVPKPELDPNKQPLKRVPLTQYDSKEIYIER